MLNFLIAGVSAIPSIPALGIGVNSHDGRTIACVSNG